MTYAIFLLTDYLQGKFVHSSIIHCMIPITMFFFSLGTVSVHKIKGALNSVELMLAYINEWKVASLRTQWYDCLECLKVPTEILENKANCSTMRKKECNVDKYEQLDKQRGDSVHIYMKKVVLWNYISCRIIGHTMDTAKKVHNFNVEL